MGHQLKHPSMLKLYNCNIFTNGGRLNNKEIVINGNKIEFVGDKYPKQFHGISLDLNGKWVCPGFIDLQIYGAGGELFQNSFSFECLQIMNSALRKLGITSFLPALTSTSLNNYKLAIKNTADFIQKHPNSVLGINIESPFINPEKSGFHDKNFLGSIMPVLFSILSSFTAGKCLVTIAPEIININSIPDEYKGNISFSAGHSSCSYELAHHFFNNGLNLATHIFNGMSGISGREPGLAGAILTNKNVLTSIIADGFHVHKANALLAYTSKGEDSLFIISDGMPSIGSNLSEFYFEDKKIILKDGACLIDEKVIAGTNVDIRSACLNFKNWFNLPIEKAIKMITETPAKALGLDKFLGCVQENYIANLVIVDELLNVDTVIVNGQIDFS